MVKTTGFSSLGLPLTESWTGGPLDGLSVTNGYDNLQRRTTVGVSNYNASVAIYGYDRASRLAGVTNGSAFAAYTYAADRGQWTKLQLGLSGTNRLTTSRVYDKADRQVSLTNASSSTDVSGFTFNTAGQMTRRDEPDGAYWIYTYDGLGQVTSGKKYWADNSIVAGQQFEYAFDDIGNRNSSSSGGDASGSNLRSVSYTKNLLNQYEGRNNPSAITVIGSAATNATVTVNLSSTVRKGAYWWGEATATNSSFPAYVGITNVAVIKGGGTNGTDLVSTNTGALLWPVASESFTNDLDGNLVADSLWTYTWDGENRLIRRESQFAVPLDFRRRLDMTYDAGSRRIGQTISTWTNSAYTLAKTKRFVYDGWNLLAELDAGKALIQAYVWGTDLSGSLTGAGGVGGLLMVNTGSASHGYAYNSNGDVRSLVSLTDGSQSAAYEYGPFGELIRSSGTMAFSNPFRFSTKCQDEESGLIYYGYRYYDARSGRWLGRDLMEEDGGVNLYAFVGNNPEDSVDYMGLWESGIHKGKTTDWAKNQHYAKKAAEAIGDATAAVDDAGGGISFWPFIGDQSYHFNRSLGGGMDSRLQHNAEHEQKARDACTAGQDNPEEAARQLGTAFHPLQDWVAHGDFFIKWEGPITAVHNMYTTQKATRNAVDNPDFDAVGPNGEMEPDGRAAGAVLQYRYVGRGAGIKRTDPAQPGMLVDFAFFQTGNLRIKKTEDLTTQHLKSFRDYVKQSGGCNCKRYFLSNE